MNDEMTAYIEGLVLGLLIATALFAPNTVSVVVFAVVILAVRYVREEI